MKISKALRICILMLFILLSTILIKPGYNPWHLTIGLGLILFYIPPQLSHTRHKHLVRWTTISSCGISLVSFGGGFLGLVIGAFINRQVYGLIVGLLFGLVVGTSSIGIIWIGYYLQSSSAAIAVFEGQLHCYKKSNRNVTYSMGMIAPSLFSMVSTNRPVPMSVLEIALSTISRGIGLSIIMTWGFLTAGLLGLVTSSVGVGLLSWQFCPLRLQSSKL